jgi:hypothetical protein
LGVAKRYIELKWSGCQIEGEILKKENIIIDKIIKCSMFGDPFLLSRTAKL